VPNDLFSVFLFLVTIQRICFPAEARETQNADVMSPLRLTAQPILEEYPMKLFQLKAAALAFAVALGLGCTITAVQQAAWCQETTGGMQGTVKDPSGAVVPGAQVVVSTPTLVGTKEATTDNAGYYRFANLPPGTYTITVTAKGFETLKRTGIALEVGRLPTIDLSLKVGGASTVVEVTTEGPMIDETTTTTVTNIPQQTLQNVPHGTSFQSVIQFAPGAREEPLMGNTMQSNGSGGSSPGSATNGGAFGFSVAGGSDSENSYLVEGQETANIIGGYSHTNVPMDFIQDEQLKTSGVQAEYGGALGGVVNVIMEKGTDHWHGSVFTSFQDGAMNGSPVAESRYDPSSSGTATSWGAIDPTWQNYQPVRPHTSDVFPGFTIGGPLFGVVPGHGSAALRDRAFMFLGFNPEFNDFEEKVNYGPTNGGVLPFSQNIQTYYTNARVDVEVTQKIRVFGSWLYQLQRESGEALPVQDSVQDYFNTSTGCYGSGTSASNPCLTGGVPQVGYAHALGYDAPNVTVNTGADITLTNSLVATSRFGYYFENYHDFGYPTSGTIYNFEDSGVGNTDTNGNALSSSAPLLNEATGYFNIAQNANYTHFNANKAIQFDQDIAWYHAGRGGTHNLKFGYQLNRNSNAILQKFNTPYVQVWPGVTDPYSPQGSVGAANCATVEAETGYTVTNSQGEQVPECLGTYGTVDVYDYGSNGKATSYNHAFFAQDAWTIGHGVTVDYGIRFEHENLPAENQPTGSIATPISFGWGSKVAPRLGGAWDVFQNGKMKVFGGYGEYYDMMKLNLAISSYGGQYWQECWYALMTPDLTSINPEYQSDGRFCEGPNSSSEANFGSGGTPSGLIFLENQNIRAFPTTCSTCSATEEGTAPGLKPYAQHDAYFGVDYQINPNLAFEVRWDRRRLDHVIEDSAIFNPAVGETFVIVNPGQGVNRTFTSFYNFLYGTAPDCSDGCPPNNTIPAARSYDGVEFRLTKAPTHGWGGMFSYIYSNFRGNYTGLTSSDVADGGGGRNAPNNSRAFDEPYFSWNAEGGSSSGLLPTDRPNALKGYGYYELPWLHKFTTDFGIFQDAYSGTPLTSYLDVGYAFPGAFPTDIVDRGKWIDVTQDPTTGAITTSSPYTKRTPWYTQTDFNLKQAFKISESKTLAFDATFTNLLNQHAVTSMGQQIDSNYNINFATPQSAGCGAYNAANYNINSNSCWLPDGPAFYAGAMTAYNYTAAMNASDLGSPAGGPITINSQYGKPYLYQLARNVRLALHFTF